VVPLAASLVAWLLLLAPPRELASIARERGGLLAACAATGAVAWWAGTATAELWLPLRDATVALVAVLLPRSGLEVGEDEAGVTLGIGDFAVVVGPTCSGYEGIGLMVVFVAAFLAWFRDVLRFPRALLLLPIGIAAAWLGNGLRLAALLEIGAHVSPEIAMGGFHAYSGSLLFSAIALGLAAFARRSGFFSRTGPEAEADAAAARPTSAASDAGAYLLPWLALLAASMVTGAASSGGPDPLYGLRLVAALAVLALRGAPLRALAVPPEPAAIGLGALAVLAWLGIAALGPAQHAAASWPEGAPSLLARAAGAIAVVPLVEELAFRGYLARRLVDRDFARVPGSRVGPLAIGLSALAFGAMHDRPLAGAVAGALYGVALRRRGEVADAVAAHATTNALLLAFVAATGRWDLWG
jgi:exosortase E/protease (VPEID-CTERM system)